MPTRVTVRIDPRSSWIHCPSPLADQRVARLLSTTLPGRLPSFVLAVTPEALGVTSTSLAGVVAVGVGVGVGVTTTIGVGVGVGVGVGPAGGAPPQFAGSASA